MKQPSLVISFRGKCEKIEGAKYVESEIVNIKLDTNKL